MQDESSKELIREKEIKGLGNKAAEMVAKMKEDNWINRKVNLIVFV